MDNEKRKASGERWLLAIEKELVADFTVEREETVFGTSLNIFACEPGLRWFITSLDWTSEETYKPVADEYAKQQRKNRDFFAAWHDIRAEGGDVMMVRTKDSVMRREVTFSAGDSHLTLNVLSPPMDLHVALRRLLSKNNADVVSDLRTVVAPVGGSITECDDRITLTVGDFTYAFSPLIVEDIEKARKLATALTECYVAHYAIRHLPDEMDTKPLRVRGFANSPIICDDRLPKGKAVEVLVRLVDPAILYEIRHATLVQKSVMASIVGDEIVLFYAWQGTETVQATLSDDERTLYPETTQEVSGSYTYLRLPITYTN